MTTLRQLEYLLAVVETGSFTRAAKSLHVSQPALSHQIAVLERSVGGPLFDRLNGSVRLTPAGRAVLPHAQAALDQVAQAEMVAQAANGLTAGELRLAAVLSATVGVLPQPLQSWRARHPDIVVRLLEYRHGREMADAMGRGDADVAIGPQPTTWGGEIRLLGDEELLVILPKDVALAHKGPSINLSELADSSWVHYAPDHGLADELDRACFLAGFTPTTAVRTEQTASVPLLVAAGLGPGLVPASMIPLNFDGQIRRTKPASHRDLVVYFRKEPDPMTLAFADHLVATCCLMPPHVRNMVEAQK